MKIYSIALQKKPGNGLKKAGMLDGLRMEKRAMVKVYGNWQVSISKNKSITQILNIVKSGEKDKTVAMNIKGSQGNKRKKWVKIEHPYTFISPKKEVHGLHNEALNTAIRRKCSAYRRKQNLYAKKVEGLNRAITVQRLIHNWVEPHVSLGKNITPAVAMGYVKRPILLEEMLNCRSWQDNTA